MAEKMKLWVLELNKSVHGIYVSRERAIECITRDFNPSTSIITDRRDKSNIHFLYDMDGDDGQYYPYSETSVVYVRGKIYSIEVSNG